MATRVQRRARRASESFTNAFTRDRQSAGKLLLASFAIGAVLEMLRSLEAIAADFRWDTALILLAAWGAAALAGRWPGAGQRGLPRVTALLLVVLFVGTWVMHRFLNQH